MLQVTFLLDYIGQLERGEKSPSLNALFVLAKTCRMLPSEVLKVVEERMASTSTHR
jgi:hypothetical protein